MTIMPILRTCIFYIPVCSLCTNFRSFEGSQSYTLNKLKQSLVARKPTYFPSVNELNKTSLLFFSM